MTTMIAIKNLLNKKYIGCRSDILLISLLISSKIGEN